MCTFKRLTWHLLCFSSSIRGVMDYACESHVTQPDEVLDKKTFSATAPLFSCMRLYDVTGFDNRKNDVVYCRPNTSLSERSVVVFFGGDVQDFIEEMEKNKHTENHECIKWNLESTADLLHTCFPDKHIVVIRPSRMDFNTYSCFQNFVPVIKYGAPEHSPMHNALQHLDKLLEKITYKLKISSIKEAETVAELNECDLLLIGFSKGCVVLNQFLYEFHYIKTLAPDDERVLKIIQRIKDMYWLDGGHSGGKNTWITSRCLLETLANLEIKIHVHVTPYQMCDIRRPWIAIEEKQFTHLLKEMNADIDRVFHFQDDKFIDLSTHFELLSVFRRHPPLVDSLVTEKP